MSGAKVAALAKERSEKINSAVLFSRMHCFQHGHDLFAFESSVNLSFSVTIPSCEWVKTAANMSFSANIQTARAKSARKFQAQDLLEVIHLTSLTKSVENRS